MINFADYQQKAKQLATRFSRVCGQHVGCLSFFSLFSFNHVALNDATTISFLAHCLDDTYDLICYVKHIKENPNLSVEEFNDFRSQVIIGIYLLKWSQYNSLASTYLHKTLIDIFRTHLGVSTLEEFDKDLFNSCLHALSYYCTFVYNKRDEEVYANLHQLLGATIQKDIYEVRYLFFHHGSAWYELYQGIMSSLGMCV